MEGWNIFDIYEFFFVLFIKVIMMNFYGLNFRVAQMSLESFINDASKKLRFLDPPPPLATNFSNKKIIFVWVCYTDLVFSSHSRGVDITWTLSILPLIKISLIKKMVTPASKILMFDPWLIFLLQIHSNFQTSNHK